MILIGLGANLPSHAGSPADTLRAALVELARYGVTPLKVSRIYKSPAWPDPRDPAYANAIARVSTTLSPGQLMTRLHETETAFGRHRSARNAPRTLDLDLLDYEGRVEQGPPILPHPRIAERAFVLVPLEDIAPDWVDPVSGRSVSEILSALPEGARSLPLW
jgi:2-amino-4-hydroxy-6-hydroxymethyldihydropteridine diphosphokinase